MKDVIMDKIHKSFSNFEIFIYLFIHLFIYLFTHLFIYLFIYLFLFYFIYLFIFLIKAENSKVITPSIPDKKYTDANLQVVEV